MAQSMGVFLRANGVDSRTAESVMKTLSAMAQGKPQKLFLAAQLVVASAAGPGGLTRPEDMKMYEGWPCKWYVPEMNSDGGEMAVREIAKSIAGL